MKPNDSNPKPPDRPYPFRVQVRPLLTNGGFGFGPESLFILLAEGQSKTEAGITMWHEVVHMLKRLKGPGTVHDEPEVERIAQKLYAACPEILELCGLEHHFKNEPPAA